MSNLKKYKTINPNDIKRIIKAFFISTRPTFANNINVNDNVVETVWLMVSETKECTKALNLVPRPAGSIPGPLYIATQLTLLAKRLTVDKDLLSDSCKSSVLLNYSRVLQMASEGI